MPPFSLPRSCLFAGLFTILSLSTWKLFPAAEHALPVPPGAVSGHGQQQHARPIDGDIAVEPAHKGGGGAQRVYVTVTATERYTATQTLRAPQPPLQTGPINRDFEKFEAPEEEFKPLLSKSDQKLLAGIKQKSNRDERIKTFYSLNGVQDWKSYINGLDDDAVPPLTKFTQKYLYDHQHPKSCSNKKFLVMNHFMDKNGLGTVVHGIGFILNVALRNNRILIYNYSDDLAPGRHFVEENCQGPQKRSLDCIYEPITSCSWEDVTEKNSITVKAYWDVPESIRVKSGTVPPVLGAALKERFPGMMPNAIKYWWRTQAAGYVMRMNGPAMERMKELRLNSSMHTGFTRDEEVGEAKTVEVPFPLPVGSFSMHVRHGDKGIEMELVPFTSYITLAESYTSQNPLSTQKSAFLSTEDDSVFSEARDLLSLPPNNNNNNNPANTTSTKNWTFYHSHIPRINGGPEEQLKAFGNRTEMTIKWMQQLVMAGVECGVFVGTRGSGWNRLVDEVRCIWGGGCLGTYLEVGKEVDWVHYNY